MRSLSTYLNQNQINSATCNRERSVKGEKSEEQIGAGAAQLKFHSAPDTSKRNRFLLKVFIQKCLKVCF